MKIALMGYGKMGKQIEQLAVEKGHAISAILTSSISSKKESEELLGRADVCIDFSHHDTLLSHVEWAAAAQKNIVIGTTGWERDLENVKKIVLQAGIGCLYSPNFSIGIHFFLQLIAQASSIAASWEECDVGLIEAHHRQKQDAPSGTAKEIARIILEQHPQKQQISKEGQKGDTSILSVATLRCGFIPGTHSVILDSPCDTITLTHQARDRSGFASGSIRAAEWLIGRQGFFGFQDIFAKE
jgi:4-hydroxy-tetrahydrodipicolinate reductase